MAALLTCLCLGACAATPKPPVAPAKAPKPPVAAKTSALAPARICNVDSLAMQRSRYIESAQGGRLVSGAPASDAEVAKMRSFAAAVDVQYRTTVSACRAYIQCMEAHHYDEAGCRMSQDRWQTAERDFSDLAIALAKHAPAARRAKAVAKPRSRAPSPQGACTDDCKPVAAGLTGCCN